MTYFPRNTSFFLLAALVTGVIASLLQTQINLASVAALGGPVTWAVRQATTLEDLARFGPVLFGIAVGALLPTLLTGSMAARYLPARWRLLILVVAAVVGMGLMFWLMRSVIPMPAIAAIRDTIGHVLMSLTGISGGLLFGYLTSPSRQTPSARKWHRSGITAVCLGVPALSFFAMAPRPDAGANPVVTDRYDVQTVATGLNRPWSVAVLPDGRLLVTEMAGRLLVINGDGASQEVALTGVPPIFHQRSVIGLMEVALDPDFAQNATLYLSMGYGEREASGIRLVRARLAGNRLEDARVLFSSTPKSNLGNNGGRMAFLPDNTLALTVGDGSARREEAQNTANNLGSVVRVDRDGNPPADNPFRNQPNTAPGLYSIGHRNAQRIAVDPVTGELYLTEHGPRGGDEINRITPGGNYGWPLVTGGIDYPFARVSPFQRLQGYLDPLLEWTPSIAPSGLAIYHGDGFPEWQGDLLVPALKERSLRRVIREQGNVVGQELLLTELDARIRDVKVAPDGFIYVLTDGTDAKLLRLTPPPGGR